MNARLPVLKRPRHLLVRLPNPLGDAVLATPALRALRAALSDVRITWAGGPAAQAVLEGLPDRDGVVPLAGRLRRGLGAPFRAARLLRRLGADTVLLLPNSWSSAIAARRAGIRTRVGGDCGRRRLLLTHRVPLPLDEKGKLKPRPMTEHYLDLVAPFGAYTDGRGPLLATTPFDEQRAARRLLAAPSTVPLLGINPGAAFGPTKVYPPARIGEVVRRVRQEREVFPVVFCGPGEEDLARATAQAVGTPCLSTHTDPPSLGELKALLRCVAVLCTTDAGPRHMAEASGVPTVVWVGPTDPRWSAGGDATVLRQDGLDCLGCHLRKCPIGLPCMNDLDPARVAAAVLERLP